MGQIDVTVLSKKGSPKLVQGSTGVFIKLIENLIITNFKPISKTFIHF